MGNVFYFDFEIKIMEWLQSFENPILTSAAKFFTLLGDEYLMIVILGFCYWSFKKDLGRKVSLSVCASMMFSTLIKGAFLRRRPYMDNESVKCIRAAYPDEDIMDPSIQGYSLPSMHSSNSVSEYGTIFKNVSNVLFKIICILLPILIGLSRIYLGVHYPTDILLGLLIGLLSVIIFSIIEKKYGYKIGFIVILLLSLVGFFYCRDAEFYSCYGVTLGLFLGFVYEEKKVNFDNSKKIFSIILRPLLGLIIFIIISTILKLPVKNITSDSYFLLLYRFFRYTLSTFVIIGLYPHLFKKFKI